ncbi:MAG: zinc-dependent peptidase [Deltaproteobacteria bacterium]|nr:zinc-dependent peptidase [Deltaproteobacteria bacterium]
MYHWLREYRRKKILAEPFPPEWRAILAAEVKHYSFLNAEEKHHLEQLLQVFVGEKKFIGCNGLEIVDEIRVVIAADACMLILGLPHDLYRRLATILVYPSTVVVPPPKAGVFTQSPLLERPAIPIAGQAFLNGPVILVWDEVKKESRHPERGHNVVYHEFAHYLDMLDGRADGTPELHSREQYRQWAEVFTAEFLALRRQLKAGEKTFFDPYGATNEAEFFAVATELFFDQPVKMQETHQALYAVMAAFYQQDTAERERRRRKDSHGG